MAMSSRLVCVASYSVLCWCVVLIVLLMEEEEEMVGRQFNSFEGLKPSAQVSCVKSL